MTAARRQMCEEDECDGTQSEKGHREIVRDVGVLVLAHMAKEGQPA